MKVFSLAIKKDAKRAIEGSTKIEVFSGMRFGIEKRCIKDLIVQG